VWHGRDQAVALSSRVVAVGDHIQASLNGQCWLDHRDSRDHSGPVGLWTTADAQSPSMTSVVRGVVGGG
jgi:hypothetical protein